MWGLTIGWMIQLQNWFFQKENISNNKFFVCINGTQYNECKYLQFYFNVASPWFTTPLTLTILAWLQIDVGPNLTLIWPLLTYVIYLFFWWKLTDGLKAQNNDHTSKAIKLFFFFERFKAIKIWRSKIKAVYNAPMGLVFFTPLISRIFISSFPMIIYNA